MSNQDDELALRLWDGLPDMTLEDDGTITPLITEFARRLKAEWLAQGEEPCGYLRKAEYALVFMPFTEYSLPEGTKFYLHPSPKEALHHEFKAATEEEGDAYTHGWFDGHEALIQEAVNRFLGWKLPKDFAPDGAITFQKTYYSLRGQETKREYGDPFWPVGTNLFTADQARAMLEYVLQGEAPPDTQQEPVARVLIEKIRVAVNALEFVKARFSGSYWDEAGNLKRPVEDALAFLKTPPAPQQDAHTNHPSRHYDRTCPVCNHSWDDHYLPGVPLPTCPACGKEEDRMAQEDVGKASELKQEVREGFALVPIEPTWRMMNAGIKKAQNEEGTWGMYVGRIFDAMIAAAKEEGK